MLNTTNIPETLIDHTLTLRSLQERQAAEALTRGFPLAVRSLCDTVSNVGEHSVVGTLELWGRIAWSSDGLTMMSNSRGCCEYERA